jgi:hypothetical protein
MGTMAEITNGAVERRAKALAEADGFAWQLELQPVRPGAKVDLQAYLSPERRQQYLDRARAELHKEAGNA